MAEDLPDPETAIWAALKRSLFEGRPMHEGAAGIVELDAPARAEDAAVVPIAIRTKLEQTTERYVRRIYLIVDNNPSPIAAIFDLSVESGRPISKRASASSSTGTYERLPSSPTARWRSIGASSRRRAAARSRPARMRPQRRVWAACALPWSKAPTIRRRWRSS